MFFSSTSATGCLCEPNNPHIRASIVADLKGLTLHGLRQSFKSLTEWLEVPVGVVAQIQAHTPSATAEKHYTVRPRVPAATRIKLMPRHAPFKHWHLGIFFLND